MNVCQQKPTDFLQLMVNAYIDDSEADQVLVDERTGAVMRWSRKGKKNFTPCCAHHSVTCCYSANGRRVEYCDEHVCVSLCVFLWTSPEVPDFLHLLTVIVARSSSDSVTMYFWFCE